MSELMQAAERLREVERTGNGCMVYKCPAEDAVNAMQRDEAAVIDEYLRLTDPTPIDEAFVRAVGWAQIEGRDTWRTYVSPKSMRTGPVVHITWDPMLGCDVWFVGGELVPDITTRGQLRMLCAALAIGLKE